MLRGKSCYDGWLTAFWGSEFRGAKKDIIFGSPSRSDGRLLYGVFCYLEASNGKTFLQELEDRGYDITTLQFAIKRTPVNETTDPLPTAEKATTERSGE